MKKFTINLLIAIIFLLSVSNSISQTSTPPSGSGTSIDPYQIATLDNLYWLTQTSSAWATGKYIIQTADIDASSTNTWASGAGFSPIGNLTTRFCGNYNGNNKTISNLYISKTGDQIGMFGYAQSGYIQNLTLSNASINATNINAYQGVGILMGGSYLSTVYNVTISSGTLSGYGTYSYMGAFCGRSQNTTFTCCKTSATITHTYSSDISYSVGGFIGYSNGDYTTYCSSTGNVSARTNSRLGGFAGVLTLSSGAGYISNCFASGNVVSTCSSGGGGFVGCVYTITVTDCYAFGNVTSGSEAGGFFEFAQSSPSFIRCYSKGTVSGSSTIGGFGGYAEAPIVTNCYWDKESSGKTNAFGYGSPNGTITGKTTAEMKTQSTFTNWDFNSIWNINESINGGYPFLRDPYTWLGTISTDWNVEGNWSSNTLPTTSNNVVILNVANKPVISTGNTGSVKNIVINNGSSVTVNGTLNLAGAVTNTGTFSALNGEMSLVGTSSQNTSGYSGTFKTLTINNSNGVSLSSSVNVTSSLNLTNGILSLGTYNLTLGSAATISGTPSATNMVVAASTGELRKTFTGTGSFTFPVGDNTGTAEYSPITLNFTSGTFSSAYAGVNLANSKHPNNTSVTDYLNRYWTVNQSGISNFSCEVTAQYLPADVSGTEVNIYCGKYSSSVWTLLNATDAINHRISGTVTGFSVFTGGQQSVMPVELCTFNSSVNGRDVKLAWTTAKEINNAGFEIQKSDLDKQNTEWTTIGFVKGNNNQNIATNYSYTDSKLNVGKYKYRLKQIDNNGNYNYHSLENIIEISSPGKFGLNQNYPNPFNPKTKIDFQIAGDEKVTLKIYDVTGKEVITLINNEFRKANFYTQDFNANNLASGIYFYKLTAGKYSQIKKMILVK